MKNIIGLVVVIGLIGGIFGYLQFSKTLDNTADLKSNFTLGAQELFSAFEIDESAANKKYLDKVVTVNGVVGSTKVDEGKTNIYLETEDMLANIACQLESPTNTIPNAGDAVKIKGVCTGYLTDVVLVRSVILK